MKTRILQINLRVASADLDGAQMVVDNVLDAGAIQDLIAEAWADQDDPEISGSLIRMTWLGVMEDE